MNGDTQEIWRRRTRLLLCAAAGSLLCACVTLPDVVEPYAGAPVDPGSPAAAAIAAQAASRTEYPTFADIPQLPTDLRSTEGWRMAVAGTEEDREGLLRDTAPSTFSLSDTDAFAARSQAIIAYDPADVPTAADAAATEAWAKAMRERATPPPRSR
jgi:hypothetical protein